MSRPRTFASDNNAGIHPLVLDAIGRANDGHALAYGNDPWTERATGILKKHLGEQAEVYFVFNGTGANVLGLSAAVKSYQSVFCSQAAHIAVDECGAPERFIGCKLIPIACPDGKLSPELIQPHLKGVGDTHHVQARGISITQSTEVGTVYSPREIVELSKFAHGNGLILHVDGARIANAAASLGVSLREMVTDCGVDVLSLGGTKNGLLMGEAVVILNPALAADFKYLRKQSMQLASKMRFISAQFEALMEGDLWLRNARHANQMATLFASELERLPGVIVTQKVQANGVFVRLPVEVIAPLQRESFFYVWNEEVKNGTQEVRLMCSFDTQKEDITAFIGRLKSCLTKI